MGTRAPHQPLPWPSCYVMGPPTPCSSCLRDGTTQQHVLHFLHLDSLAPPPLLFLNTHNNHAKLDPPPHRVPGPRARISARAERHRSVHSPCPCAGSPAEATPCRSCLGCHAAPHRAERQRTHAPHLIGARLGVPQAPSRPRASHHCHPSFSRLAATACNHLCVVPMTETSCPRPRCRRV